MTKIVLFLACLGIVFGIGYKKGEAKGILKTKMIYEKQMSEYSVLFTPSQTRLVKNSELKNLKSSL